ARFRDLIETAGVEPTTLLSCSEAVEFVSEYRGFVHRGELVGCKHYAGDFRVAPDFAPIEAALEEWEARPVACSMDWGVTREGRTLLIEVNDAYSLGCYGLSPLLYAPMLADRWFQITGSRRRA
ncbi:MAG: ATP-grasp domain-containing protein, partial [Armatimonadetes bacterium]|nr:ATP-grasp domain-containing protein [Armatimonadota bacterium]